VNPRPASPDCNLSALVFLAAFVFYLLTMRGFTTGEGWEHFALARHLLTTGSLSTPAEAWSNQMPGPSGAWYNVHDFGNTLLMLPFAAAIELAARIVPRLGGFDHMVVSVYSCAVLAAVVAALYRLLRALAVEPRRALLVCALGAAGTQLWPYTRESYDGLAFALFLTLGAAESARWLARPSPDALARAGLFLGLTVVTRPPGVLWVAALALPLLFSVPAGPERRRHVAALGLALVPSALWVLFYNFLRTGKPWLPPIATHDHLPGARTPYWKILPALLVSPACGVFFFNPALLIGGWGLPALYRRHRRFAHLCAAGLLGHLLIYGGTPIWMTYSSWGWRFGLMIVPLLLVPVAFVEADAWRRWRAPFIGLIAASVLIQALAVTVDHTNLIYFHMKPPSDETLWSIRENELAITARELPHVVARWTGAEPWREWPEIKGPRQLSANYGSLWFLIAGAFGLPVWGTALVVTGLTAALAGLIRTLRRRTAGAS
jgi:hypothetical protein